MPRAPSGDTRGVPDRGGTEGTPVSFYDHIAGDYDAITGQAGRTEGARAFLRALRERVAFASAVDVACGTGLFTRALAEMGVATVGADLSTGMLAEARRQARQAGLSVEWICSPMESLASRVPGPRDLVLCMGNSLPHLLTERALADTLDGFAAVLADGGTLVLHVLNYARVLDRAERIVGADRHGQGLHVRFYDFLDEKLVRFHILSLDLSAQPIRHDLHSTDLRPWRPGELADACRRAGFADIQCHGDLAFATFDEGESDVLLLTARRRA